VRARTLAYIGIGSNLGDRVAFLEKAYERLHALPGIRCLALSGLYETSPVGLDGAPFLNTVALIETGMGPEQLLDSLLTVEAAAGRTRKRGEPRSRTLDLDLLLYGEAVIKGEKLTVPHPRMLDRRFVLEPLAELAPDLTVPPSGISVSRAAEELAACHPEQTVKRLGTLKEVKESLTPDV